MNIFTIFILLKRYSCMSLYVVIRSNLHLSTLQEIEFIIKIIIRSYYIVPYKGNSRTFRDVKTVRCEDSLA